MVGFDVYFADSLSISGAIGVVWYVLWAIFTSNAPEQHRWITEEEKTYIITSVEKEKSKNVITVSFPQPVP